MEEKEAVQKLVAMMVAGKEISEDEVNTLEAVLLNVSGKLDGDLKADFYETLKDKITSTGADIFVGNIINVSSVKDFAEEIAKNVIKTYENEKNKVQENPYEQSMKRSRDKTNSENKEVELKKMLKDLADSRFERTEKHAKTAAKVINQLGFNFGDSVIQQQSEKITLIEDIIKTSNYYCQTGIPKEEAMKLALQEFDVTEEVFEDPEFKLAFGMLVSATLDEKKAINVQNQTQTQGNSSETKGSQQDQSSTTSNVPNSNEQAIEVQREDANSRTHEMSNEQVIDVIQQSGLGMWWKAFFNVSVEDSKDVRSDLNAQNRKSINGIQRKVNNSMDDIIANKGRIRTVDQGLRSDYYNPREDYMGYMHYEIYIKEMEGYETEVAKAQAKIRGKEDYVSERSETDKAKAFKDYERTDKILDYVMDRYFKTGMSLSHIYEEIKMQSPTEDVYFYDLQERLKDELQRKNVNSLTINAIINSENEIRNMTLDYKSACIYRDIAERANKSKKYDTFSKKAETLKKAMIKKASGNSILKSNMAKDGGYDFDMSVTDSEHLPSFYDYLESLDKENGQEIDPNLVTSKFQVEEIQVYGESKGNQEAQKPAQETRPIKEKMGGLKHLLEERKISKGGIFSRLKAIKKARENTIDMNINDSRKQVVGNGMINQGDERVKDDEEK